MRRRIVAWFALLVVGGALLSLVPASFASKAMLIAPEAAWLGCLSALPVWWSVRARGA